MSARDPGAARRPVPSRPAEPGRPGRRPASPRISPGTGPVSQTYLPADPASARQARVVIRDALLGWGLGALAGDAELLGSELVANASEHAGGSPVRLTIRPHTEPNGRRGILCRVTDLSPDPLEPRLPEPDSERGRGLQIVAALATSSGVTANRQGKTAWFTLAAPPGRTADRRHAGYEAEPGA
jgi:anti-sigma regulatory factor (Ser/Thr protein kinase)